MQDTRLNNLIAASARQLNGWAANPWRRTSIQCLALLLGFFCASAAITTAGQAAVWDMSVTAMMVVGCELISAIYYARRDRRSDPGLTGDPRSPQLPPTALPPGDPNGIPNNGILAPRPNRPWIGSLNLFKIGLIYGLFLEGFKLGS